MKLIAPFFAFSLVAAACGGGSDDTAADETTTTEATSTESSDEETTTTEAVDEETTTTAAADGDAEGAGSAYCNASAESDRLIDDWDIGSPESTEQYFTEILDLIDSIDPPSEIAEDFAVLRQGFVDLSAELEAVGWNILAVDQDNPILDDPATEAQATARRRVAYVAPGIGSIDHAPVLKSTSANVELPWSRLRVGQTARFPRSGFRRVTNDAGRP